jgi:hypothetical protein
MVNSILICRKNWGLKSCMEIVCCMMFEFKDEISCRFFSR